MYYSVPVAKFAYQTSDDKERAEYVLRAANFYDSSLIQELTAALYGTARRAILEIDDGHCWCEKPIKRLKDIDQHEDKCLAARAALAKAKGSYAA